MSDTLALNTLSLRLPYPPTVNTYWRHNRGRVHVSAEGERYQSAVLVEVLSLQPKLRAYFPFTGPLDVSVNLIMPDRRRRDIDNIAKAVLDALQNARVYQDDRQIDRLTIRRGPVEKPGAAVVAIRRMGAG